MTGYVGTKFAESYGIVVDYVDDELTELIRVRIQMLEETWSTHAFLEYKTDDGCLFFILHVFIIRSMPESTVIFPSMRPSAAMPVRTSFTLRDLSLHSFETCSCSDPIYVLFVWMLVVEY